MEDRKNKIIVPLDFHEQSMIALDQTKSIAKFMNAEIIILYIIESTDIISAMFRKEEQTKKIYDEVKKKLEILAAETSKKFNLPVSVRIEKGKVYEKILHIADERFLMLCLSGCITILQYGWYLY